MLNFDDELSFSFQYKSKAYNVRYATKQDVDKYESFLDEAKEDSNAVQNVAFKFLALLGAEENVLRELPMRCVAQLVNEAVGLEKK